MNDTFLSEPFVMIPVRLLKDRRLRRTPAAITIYGLIFKHERREKTPYIGRTRLAEETGCSVDTVDRAIRKLIETGWLIIERRTGQTHRYYRGDGRTGAAPTGTDAAPIWAWVRPEVDGSGVDEAGNKSERPPDAPAVARSARAAEEEVWF